MLLKSGASANLTTDDGQTPVHVAASNGSLPSLLLLLEDGGDAMYKSNVNFVFVFSFFANCTCALKINFKTLKSTKH